MTNPANDGPSLLHQRRRRQQTEADGQPLHGATVGAAAVQVALTVLQHHVHQRGARGRAGGRLVQRRAGVGQTTGS